MTEVSPPQMSVNAAINQAKSWLKAVYVDEQITNLGLEEIWFDSADGKWKVTLGFSRPWNKLNLPTRTGEPIIERSLKTVTVDQATGQISSILDREPPRR